MTEETTITTKEGSTTVTTPTSSPGTGTVVATGITPDSSVGGVSVRAWLAVVLILTVCLTHLLVTTAVLIDAIIKSDFSKVGTFATIGEPLYSATLIALGFYFGLKTGKS